MNIALLFPGQGSQFVGMGADLFDLRPELLVHVADEVLGWSLRDVCLNGPEEALTATDRAQPALFALSFALWDVMSEHVAPTSAAGHSLGEYTALAAAGAFSFASGLSLVAARGRAMAQAATEEAGSMAALVGADLAAAETLAARCRDDGGRLWVANINAPSQIVIAGAEADVAWAVENAREFGIRRAIRLNVAGAFHTPLMASAQDRLKAAMALTKVAEPTFDVWANASASPTRDIKQSLAEQLTGPVRFSETLEALAPTTDLFLHIGPGDVTAGMVKRTVPGSECLVFNDSSQVSEIVARIEDLGTMSMHKEAE